jgi:predicted acetyltransferase
MTIEPADWHDVLQVLHETYRIWSPGLTKAAYQQYIWGQMSHSWSKNHYRYLVYKRNGSIAASCKTYELVMTARGREYRVLGIGSVYSRLQFRGTGAATAMLEDLVESAMKQEYDGMLLYSEIGPEFYERLGFEELGAADFSIFKADSEHPSRVNDEQATQSNEAKPSETAATIQPVPLQYDHIAWLVRHHSRWLRGEPYGCVRSEQYWHYKLTKEKFLQKHSQLSWPTLQLISLPEDDHDGGYMIVETGGSTLRLLEVVGSEKARLNLWKNLLQLSAESNYHRVRGWESGVKVLAPRFSLTSVLPDQSTQARYFAPVEYSERDWGRAMVLPINPELEKWHNELLCPLLELDHF